LVLLTKADKLNKAEASKALSIAKLQSSGGIVQLFSALKKQGVAQASQILWDWVHTADDPLHQAAESAILDVDKDDPKDTEDVLPPH